MTIASNPLGLMSAEAERKLAAALLSRHRDRPLPLFGLLEEGDDAVVLADVARDTLGLAARFADVGDGLVERLGAATADRDAGAERRAPHRHVAAEPRAAAGDDEVLAG